MTKAELIDLVAEQVQGTSKAQVSQIYDAIFDTIIRAIKEDDKHRYLVKDFGTFELKQREARKGRNPATGQEIDIPASTTVGFRPAAGLKEKLG